jgi:hypothetical protein
VKFCGTLIGDEDGKGGTGWDAGKLDIASS